MGGKWGWGRDGWIFWGDLHIIDINKEMEWEDRSKECI